MPDPVKYIGDGNRGRRLARSAFSCGDCDNHSSCPFVILWMLGYHAICIVSILTVLFALKNRRRVDSGVGACRVDAAWNVQAGVALNGEFVAFSWPRSIEGAIVHA